MQAYHIPVLLQESVNALLGSDRDGVYADATFGGGGHSREILSRLSDKGRLIAFDRDEDASANAPDDSRFTLVSNNFRFIHNYVLYYGYPGGIDGILADLGVSSHQFDTAERGFSFRFDAPLDMRMNAAGEKSAKDVVNGYPQEELEKIFYLYGEVDNARRVADALIRERAKGEIATTSRLNAVLEPFCPAVAAHKYLAKVYQALRIEVNDEMRSLEKFLEGASDSLKPGGRLVVITYHSLEDRMVKNFIRCGNVEGRLEKDLYGRIQAPLQAEGRKPLLPAEAEISANTRARSAKMRVAVKVGEGAESACGEKLSGGKSRNEGAKSACGEKRSGGKSRNEGAKSERTSRKESLAGKQAKGGTAK
ncbi:MAG: 16S rRNA (cytosine(1402)-N(4))-methyltransferase RsmH [Bacteroidales bacterium]|nr:16S rRNA (cytosine(1402)-N(4))-methyltransferase RsmH [Bacteroidales bacterium]